MKTSIKRFEINVKSYENTEWADPWGVGISIDTDWDRIWIDLLNQFDVWRKNVKPKEILDIKRGFQKGIDYIEPRIAYLDILYSK